jgi:hypothetical protein
MNPRAVALFIALAASTCFAPTGSGTTTTTDATTSESTGTDAAASDASTQTGSVASGTSSMQTGPTSDATTDATSTGPDACGGLGDPCGAGCCGCLACDGNTDTCIPDDTKCETFTDPTCEAKIWGALENTCYRYAGAKGVCDAAGTCNPGACDGMGAPIENCMSAECLRSESCAPDTDAAAVTFASLCAIDAVTDECGQTCTNDMLGGQVDLWTCNADSACVFASTAACQGYWCEADGKACKQSCFNEDDCAVGYTCNAQSCVQG